MTADRKQLLASTRSAVALADDLRMSEPQPFLNPHSFPSKGQCGSYGLLYMMGYIQLLYLAGLEECCGCAPSLQLVSGAKRNIKAASRMRQEGAERIMSHWTELGAMSLSHGWWLIYYPTGEVRPHVPSLLLTTQTFHWHIYFTHHHLSNALTTMNIKKLSQLSGHTLSLEVPALIPGPANSSTLSQTGCLCQCFSYIFVLPLAFFGIFTKFLVLPWNVSPTTPLFFTHTLLSIWSDGYFMLSTLLLSSASNVLLNIRSTWIFCLCSNSCWCIKK